MYKVYKKANGVDVACITVNPDTDYKDVPSTWDDLNA